MKTSRVSGLECLMESKWNSWQGRKRKTKQEQDDRKPNLFLKKRDRENTRKNKPGVSSCYLGGGKYQDQQHFLEGLFS